MLSGHQRTPILSIWCVCLLLRADCLYAAVIGSDVGANGAGAATAAASSAAAAAAASPCAGRRPGARIAGQYVVKFQDDKVDSVSQGIASLKPAFATPSQPTAAAAAVTTRSSSIITSSSNVLPFDIVNTIGAGDAGDSSSGSRKLLARSGNKLLGLVVKIADNAAGEAVVQRLRGVNTVQYVENDLCVKVAQGSGASASWNNPACYAANTGLAWWGEKCGPSGSQIRWAGVHAYDKTSGAVITNCVKFRPSQATPSTDIVNWLGNCGQAPAAASGLPTRVCLELFSPALTADDQKLAADVQGCIAFGASVTHTVAMPHPNKDCTTKRMIQMTYSGALCDSANSTAPVTLRWLRAVPAPGSNADASKCSIQRIDSPTSVADQLFNKDWFGSCGVPPAKVQYLARGQCPSQAAPPPPNPPLPPPPREWTKLPRVSVGTGGQTVSAGVKRIMAVTQDANGALQSVTPTSPVAAALIDTGVQCNHPDLNVIYTKQWGSESNPDKSQDGGCFDGLGHGTHVSGIIGAKNNDLGVIGVMPNASIVMLKALDSSGSGQASDLFRAMRWLLETSLDGKTPNDGGQTNAQKLQISVLSMSLGFYASSLTSGIGGDICKMAQDLENAGVVVVAAASNENQPLNNAVPAGCPNTVAVTSVAQDDGSINLQNQASSFSNYLSLQNVGGTPPWTPDKMNRTIAAPGNRINSTCSSYATNNNNGYCLFSGTSQATPHVAGIFLRCFITGACRGSQGSQNVYLALQEFTLYNQGNTQYGYQQDPIRNPPVTTGSCTAGSVNCKYYGYLSWADAF